jgi:hypothetical protein
MKALIKELLDIHPPEKGGRYVTRFERQKTTVEVRELSQNEVLYGVPRCPAYELNTCSVRMFMLWYRREKAA